MFRESAHAACTETCQEIMTDFAEFLVVHALGKEERLQVKFKSVQKKK